MNVSIERCANCGKYLGDAEYINEKIIVGGNTLSYYRGYRCQDCGYSERFEECDP